MFLSDEQMGAVRHGEARPDWSAVELPVGQQPIPAWAKGLDIWWADGYGNNPSFKIKTDINARSWPDQRYEVEGARYLSRSGDGRAECYYHDGTLQPTMLKRWRTADGELRQNPRWGETKPGHVGPDLNGEWVEIERLATSQQQGFGGAHYDLTLVDGREVTLRGPWHGPCPDGFQEVAYVNTSERYYSAKDWTKCGGTGGLLIDDEVFIRIFARFCPHLRLVRVGKFLQPLKPEWDAPKHIIQQREREAEVRRNLQVLADASEPLPEDDQRLRMWAVFDFVRAGLATELPRENWRDKRRYVITDAGRAALAA